MTDYKDTPMISTRDLKPGDIIILNVAGAPHSAIYAPVPGKVGDLIQMGYGLKRSGAIKSTLTHQVEKWNKGHAVRVIRSKHLDGAAIAAQAELWLRQGVVFDERRLVNSLHSLSYASSYPSAEANVLEYLKFAARRETCPIKAQKYPYNYSSILSLIGNGINLPDVTFSHQVSKLGKKLVKKGTHKAGRPKGFTCVGFVLACLAAVVLKDEIAPVTDKTGWVSLKYSSDPLHASPHFLQTVHKVKTEIGAKYHHGPGLHDVLSPAQLESFNLERLKEKLTPLLVNQNPHHPSLKLFYADLASDPHHWEDLGFLDKSTLTKEFNPQAYRKEGQAIYKEIQINRKIFNQKFGPDIFKRSIARQKDAPIESFCLKKKIT